MLDLKALKVQTHFSCVRIIARVINKLHKEKCICYGLLGLWNIVDESNESPPSNMDPKLLHKYQICVKYTMSIIDLNLAHNQLYVHHYLQWTNKDISTSQRVFSTSCSFIASSSCKTQGKECLDHVNNVKALTDQLVYFKVLWETKTFSKKLRVFYEYLITILDMMPVKECILEYMTTRLIHKMSKQKEMGSKVRMPPWCCYRTKMPRYRDIILLRKIKPHFKFYVWNTKPKIYI